MRPQIPHQISYLLAETLNKGLQYTLAGGLSFIGTLSIIVLRVLKRMPQSTELEIYGKDFSTLSVELLEHDTWYIRNAKLFPLVLRGKLALVGISIRSMAESAAPAILRPHTPGIISLYLIRKSSRLSNTHAVDCDLEYLRERGAFTDLSLLLQSLVALLFHQSTPVADKELNIFGIRMLNISMAEAIAMLGNKIEKREKTPAFFVNADCLNKVFVDKEYCSILKSSETVFPDGSGINLAAKLLGSAVKENVNGTDMLPCLCELAQENGYNMYFLGAAPGVAESMAQKLREKYADLQICGTRSGYFDWNTEAQEVIREINSSRADILLVALGAPMQERFISLYGGQIDAPVQMGVGGLFDFYSHRIARAPLWMRQIGMEWVFRLIQEPQRMWKRYIIGNPLFIFRVYRWRNGGRKDIHQ